MRNLMKEQSEGPRGRLEIARFKIVFKLGGLNTVNCDSPTGPRISSPVETSSIRSDSG
jgi:hypothetical protein